MDPPFAHPTSRAALLAYISSDEALTSILEQVRAGTGDDAAHDSEHLLRVALVTIKLGGDRVDTREAVCAALLHDLVNLPKNHPARAQASQLSSVRARQLLEPAGLSQAGLERVVHAIEDHSYSSGRRPRSFLGEALQDADRLEALGALGIARTFSTGVRLGARYFDPEDPWAEARALDDVRFSVDHFFKKLLALPATLCTVEGRREAERRAQILRQFLIELGEEIGAPLDPVRLDTHRSPA
jgi:uncharacterized protein